MSSAAKRQNRWKLALTIITFAALGILIFAVWDEISQTITNLVEIRWYVLFGMIAFQIINYHSYAKFYQHIYRILGERIRYRSMLRVTLELNFINNVFPSGGVSGISYFALRMRDADVAASKSTVVQFTKFIFIFISFQILLGIGLLMLAIGGNVNNLTILIAGSLFTLLFVGSLGLVYILDSKRRVNSFLSYITKIINKLIHIFRPSYPETINMQKAHKLFEELRENYLLLKAHPSELKQPLIYALICNTAEVLTIYVVYIAFSSFVNPGAIILAYAVSSFAGVVSVLPGGVGIFEALMTGVLAAAGVPLGLAIPVTITYRVLNMLIQLPPGYFFYYKAIHKNTSHAVAP